MLAELFLLSAGMLILAAFITFLLRRRSAAERHLVWCGVLIALLLLPLLRFRAWTPRYQAPEAIARTVIYVTASGAPPAPRPSSPVRRVPWTALWLAGAAVAAGRFLYSHVRLAGIVRRARPGLSADTRLSGEVSVPMLCGLTAPVILLPPAAREWPREELESVLAHERMHLRRRDNWTQALAHLACVLYWPQPLVWLAAKAMRNECERACDDGVLVEGTPASAYAGVLVNMARALSAHPAAAPAGGIAMTRTSQLHRRIAALLDPGADRRPAGRSSFACSGALMLALLIGAAGLELPVFAQQGRFNGVVRDASGAVVPKARVDLKSVVDGAEVREVVYTNDAGEFSLDRMPDGSYDVTVAKPGFALLTQANLLFTSGKTRPIELTLNVGQIRERVAVVGSAGPVPVAAAAGEPKRIRVGGNVQSSKLLTKVPPQYPAGARADRVEGTVLLNAIIGTDGSVIKLEPLNRVVDQRLVDSAKEAVSQWRYSPTLLNGNPIEVITVVEVNYTLLP